MLELIEKYNIVVLNISEEQARRDEKGARSIDSAVI